MEAIGFHFVDYVVHGWDVARALGVGYDLEPDVLTAARLAGVTASVTVEAWVPTGLTW